MSGGYILEDGTLVLDENHDTSPAAVVETSPCGQAIKQKQTTGTETSSDKT